MTSEKPSGSLVDLYIRMARQNPQDIAFRSSPPDFAETLTWAEVLATAYHMSLELRNRGLQPGDTVGIMAITSWRWEVAQLAGFMARAIVIGIDSNDSAENLLHIHQISNVKFLFFDKAHLLDKWNTAIGPSLSQSIQTLNTESIQKIQSRTVNFDPFAEKNFAQSRDIAFITFTSGTTSRPKAIQYSHSQMLLSIETLTKIYILNQSKGYSICWLPLANLFQRMINFCTVNSGGEIYFIEKPTEVMQHLKNANPTVFASVPRFYEKIFDQVNLKIGSLPLPLRLFMKSGIALSVAIWKLRQKYQIDIPIERGLFVWELLFFKKIRSLFGQRIQFLISGSAPLRKDLNIFFHSIGLPILEAYGTSENPIPVAANTLAHFKVGSVGRPIPPNLVHIAPSGEILIKGPTLFTGYMHTDSSDAFENGYYKTGDLGHFDADGFLFIEGRINSIFKTSTGKKVPATEYEIEFKKLPFVDQVLTLGHGRKFPILFISIDPAIVAKSFSINFDQLTDPSTGEIRSHWLDMIKAEVKNQADSLKMSVKPAGALLLMRRLSLNLGEITPNLKVRTKAIAQSFSIQIDELYLELENSGQFHTRCISEGSVPPSQPVNQIPKHRLTLVIALVARVFFVLVRLTLQKKDSHRINRELAQLIRRGLGQFKGPLQKVGQMMSYLGYALPTEFREELNDLISQGAPINPSVVKGIIETELHNPIPAIFAEFEDTPISTASIGQVHWARLNSGEEVAVKVLIPGVEGALKTDLRILKLCLPILGKILKFKSIHDHYDEMRELLENECDLQREAKNLKTFQMIFKDDPELRIPKVFSQYSTRRVLVMEYLHGQTFEEFKTSASDIEKQWAAKVLWTISSRSINRFAIFNADPHPGNFIFMKNQIGLIDFGFCKRWSPEFIHRWKKQVISGLGHNIEEFRKNSRAVGMMTDSDEFYEDLHKVYHQLIYLPWLKDEDFTFTHDFVRSYLEALMKSQISVPNLRLSKEFLSLSRLYWGNFSLMAELNATANFHRLTIPYIKEPLQMIQESP